MFPLCFPLRSLLPTEREMIESQQLGETIETNQMTVFNWGKQLSIWKTQTPSPWENDHRPRRQVKEAARRDSHAPAATTNCRAGSRVGLMPPSADPLGHRRQLSEPLSSLLSSLQSGLHPHCPVSPLNPIAANIEGLHCVSTQPLPTLPPPFPPELRTDLVAESTDRVHPGISHEDKGSAQHWPRAMTLGRSRQQ